MYDQNRNRGFDSAIRELKDRSKPTTNDIDIVEPRYLDWFEGERLAAPAIISEKPTVVDIHAATRALTKALMEKAGLQTYHNVSSRMPDGSRLRKALQARAMDHNPQHGACRVGRVILGRNDDEFTAAEFYVTNFDAQLSTATKQFYMPTNKAGGMFFGVGVIIDEQGRQKRFDRRNGMEGMYFQTKDLGKAIYAIASISTGMSVDQLMNIDKTDNNSVKRSRAG
jgi:hypothetical protein